MISTNPLGVNALAVPTLIVSPITPSATSEIMIAFAVSETKVRSRLLCIFPNVSLLSFFNNSEMLSGDYVW